MSPPQAPPPAPAVAPALDLRPFAGRPYADLAAAHPDRFGNEALTLSAAEAARLVPLVGASRGAMLDGGGAQALVFRGCAEAGCADGVGVIAIDAATGASFAGVRDAAGQTVLTPHDRLEVLLRLNAPTRNWADAGAAPSGANDAPPASDGRP